MRKTLVIGLFLSLVAAPGRAELERELTAFLSVPPRLALGVYRRWIGPAKGVSCPMTPSDSAYAVEAFQRYGAWGGLWRAADRLHRCGHDAAHYPLVPTRLGLRHHDPLR